MHINPSHRTDKRCNIGLANLFTEMLSEKKKSNETAKYCLFSVSAITRLDDRCESGDDCCIQSITERRFPESFSNTVSDDNFIS